MSKEAADFPSDCTCPWNQMAVLAPQNQLWGRVMMNDNHGCHQLNLNVTTIPVKLFLGYGIMMYQLSTIVIITIWCRPGPAWPAWEHLEYTWVLKNIIQHWQQSTRMTKFQRYHKKEGLFKSLCPSTIHQASDCCDKPGL